MRQALTAPERINCGDECIYKQIDPRECENCRVDSDFIDPFVSRLFHLWELKEAGCCFSLVDLPREEWNGLIIIHQELKKAGK